MGPSLCVRMKPGISYTHNRAYQAASEKQTGFWPVRTPLARYTRVPERFQPPDCVPEATGTGHTPRKLPRFHEQSPASSHNTPVPSHRRFINITVQCPEVKQFFVFLQKFFYIFCNPCRKSFPGGKEALQKGDRGRCDPQPKALQKEECACSMDLNAQGRGARAGGTFVSRLRPGASGKQSLYRRDVEGAVPYNAQMAALRRRG